MAANDKTQSAMGSALSASDGSDRGHSSATSATSATKFASLMNQKRNSSDETGAARRASFADQNKSPGFLGGLWNSFTKRSGPASK